VEWFVIRDAKEIKSISKVLLNKLCCNLAWLIHHHVVLFPFLPNMRNRERENCKFSLLKYLSEIWRRKKNSSFLSEVTVGQKSQKSTKTYPLISQLRNVFFQKKLKSWRARFPVLKRSCSWILDRDNPPSTVFSLSIYISLLVYISLTFAFWTRFFEVKKRLENSFLKLIRKLVA